jgi:hypothetical protein
MTADMPSGKQFFTRSFHPHADATKSPFRSMPTGCQLARPAWAYPALSGHRLTTSKSGSRAGFAYVGGAADTCPTRVSESGVPDGI